MFILQEHQTLQISLYTVSVLGMFQVKLGI